MNAPKIIVSQALSGGFASSKRSFFIDEFETWRAEQGESKRSFATRLNVSHASYLRWTKGEPFNPAAIMLDKLMEDLHSHRVAITKKALGEPAGSCGIFGGFDEDDPWYHRWYTAHYRCPWCGSPRGPLTFQVNLHARTFNCSYGKCPLNDPDTPGNLFNTVGDLLDLPRYINELRKSRGEAPLITTEGAKVSIDTTTAKPLSSLTENIEELPVLFSERLRYARTERKLSQEALAKQLGCSRVSIYNWEHGKTAPQSSQLLLLERVLGVNFRSSIRKQRKGKTGK